MKGFKECLYYLTREAFNNQDGDCGWREKEEYFNDVLEHIKNHGLIEVLPVEIISLVEVAELRGRIKELDEAVEIGSAKPAATLAGQLLLPCQ